MKGHRYWEPEGPRSCPEIANVGSNRQGCATWQAGPRPARASGTRPVRSRVSVLRTQAQNSGGRTSRTHVWQQNLDGKKKVPRQETKNTKNRG